MNITKESMPSSIENERLNSLADDLSSLQREKQGDNNGGIVQKLIERLRSGDVYAAKLLCENEADKFAEYRNDGIPIIIDKLYGGNGSPWFMLERKLQQQKETNE